MACTNFVPCACHECDDDPSCQSCGRSLDSHDVTLEDYGDGMKAQDFKPRDLSAVLGDVLGIVPMSHVELKQALESVRDSTLFSAPELLRIRWQEAAYVLKHYFPSEEKDFEDWHRKIINMWQNKVQ